MPQNVLIDPIGNMMKEVIAAAFIGASFVGIFFYTGGDLGAANHLKWMVPLLVFIAVFAGLSFSKSE